MNIIENPVYSFGLISGIAVALFIYYALINSLILKSTLRNSLMVVGALLSFIVAGSILRMNDIRRAHKISLFNIFLKFRYTKYYLSSIVVLVLCGIPAYVLALILTPGEVDWFSVAVVDIWAFGAVTLAIAERTFYSLLHPSSVTATSGKRDFLLRDDLIATRAYTDLINTFLTATTPALRTEVTNAVLSEWVEEHPVLFEDCQEEEGGKINVSVVMKNLDRIYEPGRLQIVLEEFSALTSNLVNMYSMVTSSAHANETLAKSYKAVKKQHGDAPVLFDILRTMPEGVLRKEKLSLLSREELEARVKERTKELERTFVEIKKEKNFTENIIATVPDSLLVLDKDLRIKSANRTFYEKFQTEPEKVIGSSIAEILGDKEGKLSTELTKLFGTEDMLGNFELHYQSEKLGERIFNIRARGMSIAEELLVIEDITEQKRAVESLQESEERFRTIVETTPCLLQISDAAGNNLYISPNCEKVTGYTQEELRGRMIWWVHEDDTPRAKDIFERTFRDGLSGRDVEYKAVKKNGELWYGSSSWEPLKDEEGKLEGIVFQTIDITERKRAVEALKIAREELEHRVKERTAELLQANEQLKWEIEERKQAEKRVKKLELPALHRLFKQGNGYLIVEEKPNTSFKLFCKLLEYGFKGLIISRTHPSHVCEKCNVQDIPVPIIWLTHVRGENYIAPTNITQLSIAVKDFAEKEVEGVIMLEGSEYLIDQNGFEVALRFVEAMVDIVTISRCRLIIPFDAQTSSEVELHRLERELSVMNAKEVKVLILD